MKIKEFTYTKANGETSQRTLLELVEPSEHVEGIDLSELDYNTYAEAIQELKLFEDFVYQKRMELYKQYDLNHKYRKFIPSKMTNVIVEYI